MRRYLLAIIAVVAMAACSMVPAGTAGPTAVGGPAGATLCYVQSPFSLSTLIAQLERINGTSDHASVLAAVDSAITTLGQLDLDPSAEAAPWRDASIDALTQLKRRIDDPALLPNVATHEIRTLGLLVRHICPSASAAPS